jgi:hypothetical protein
VEYRLEPVSDAWLDSLGVSAWVCVCVCVDKGFKLQYLFSTWLESYTPSPPSPPPTQASLHIWWPERNSGVGVGAI